MRFAGSGILSDIASEEIFSRLKIQILDAAGNPLYTYGNGNLAQVNVLSETDNSIEIKIINQNAAAQQIKILSGDVPSLGILNHDLYIITILDY